MDDCVLAAVYGPGRLAAPGAHCSSTVAPTASLKQSLESPRAIQTLGKKESDCKETAALFD